ncbi:MAG: hypothetical protein K6G06_01615 [Butyrivibrio sp.]|nr:hypothetical protein [Butyrivibrio sp.]
MIKFPLAKIVPNTIVVSFYSVLSIFFSSVSKKTIQKNKNDNINCIKLNDNELISDSFIENQENLKNISFGSAKKSNLSYSGCGVIAAWNALVSLSDKSFSLIDLISAFEKKGIVLKGKLGVSPTAIHKYFNRSGYKTGRITSRNPEKIRRFGDSWDTFLVTFYWDKDDVFQKLHTVNISKNENKYYIHNDYFKDEKGRYAQKGPYDSLDVAIESLGQNVASLFITGISRKEDLG